MKLIFDQVMSADNIRQMLYRLLIVVVLVFVIVVYRQHEQIVSSYFETRLEAVVDRIEEERENRYHVVAKEQVQSAYALIRPDAVWILDYRPININDFIDLKYSEGPLPYGSTSYDFRDMSVSKISKEYQDHILGEHFSSINMEDSAFSQAADNDIAYRYSCPIYNLGNIYSGMVTYLWYEERPFADRAERAKLEKNYGIFCRQNSRTIGRAK